MAEFNEQEEQKKDQQYLDGYNLGYEMQKLFENKELSEKDKALLDTASKALSKSKSQSDKIQGIRDGQKLRYLERQQERRLKRGKEINKNRER